MGLGEDGDEPSYRQYGLRWHEAVSPSFGLMAELSEIQEDGSMLGSHGDVLGVSSSTSRQARLRLSGGKGGFSWQGGYLHGWTDTDLTGRGVLADVSDLQYSQWHAEGMVESLLQGADELRFGVFGTPKVHGDVQVRYVRSGAYVIDKDTHQRLQKGVLAERMTVTELSDDALIWRMGYKWSPLTLRDLDAAIGMEAVSGGASDGDYAASFQLRWAF